MANRKWPREGTAHYRRVQVTGRHDDRSHKRIAVGLHLRLGCFAPLKHSSLYEVKLLHASALVLGTYQFPTWLTSSKKSPSRCCERPVGVNAKSRHLSRRRRSRVGGHLCGGRVSP